MKTAFLFDLDGTITSTEILPCIAADIGISQEMELLTRITMDGLIDFESSFRLRCLLLGQISPLRIRKIIESIPLNNDVVNFISNNRNNSFVVTGNLDVWVEQFINNTLGCRCFSSRADWSSNNIELLSIINKSTAVEHIKKEGYEKIVAVGDGANDIPMFNASDVAIAFGGVHMPSKLAIQNSDLVIFRSDILCDTLKRQ